MDILVRNVGGHFHVVPPLLILDDNAPILLEGMVCVKNYTLNSIFIRIPLQS